MGKSLQNQKKVHNIKKHRQIYQKQPAQCFAQINSCIIPASSKIGNQASEFISSLPLLQRGRLSQLQIQSEKIDQEVFRSLLSKFGQSKYITSRRTRKPCRIRKKNDCSDYISSNSIMRMIFQEVFSPELQNGLKRHLQRIKEHRCNIQLIEFLCLGQRLAADKLELLKRMFARIVGKKIEDLHNQKITQGPDPDKRLRDIGGQVQALQFRVKAVVAYCSDIPFNVLSSIKAINQHLQVKRQTTTFYGYLRAIQKIRTALGIPFANFGSYQAMIDSNLKKNQRRGFYEKST